MLQGIAATGHQVSFIAEESNNSFAHAQNILGRMVITENADGSRTWEAGQMNGTTGCDTQLKINTSLIDLGATGSNSWREYNTMVLIAHEMSHAYNNALGNRDMSFYDNYTGEVVDMPEGASQQDGWNVGAVTGAEMQAVGIHDDDILSPNPYGMSENDYREYFHMPTRESYMD